MGSDTKSILVVEDNAVMADVVRFNLERSGFNVTVCGNGRQACETLAANTFDLLITDYQMPEMSGEELVRHVRENSRNADVPIFLCSAKGFELDLVDLSRKFGIAQVLQKPFSPRKIVELVRDTLMCPTTSI